MLRAGDLFQGHGNSSRQNKHGQLSWQSILGNGQNYLQAIDFVDVLTVLVIL